MFSIVKVSSDMAEFRDAGAWDECGSHFHSCYEVYYLISGRHRYTINNEIYDLQAGDLVLIPPMQMHKTARIPGTPKEERHQRFLFYALEIPNELLPCFDRHFYHPKGSVSGAIRQLINESMQEKRTDEYGMLLHRLNLQKVLLYLLNLPQQSPPAANLSPRDQAVQCAACYIQENCDKHLSLKDVSSLFSFTPEYFSSIFKASIGLSFVDYLNSMRISRALPMLLETDAPITVISEKCGFNDSNYFATIFRKTIGDSPSAYRKKRKSGQLQDDTPDHSLTFP